jgi:tetratricopeptide (TPR) repeat protein
MEALDPDVSRWHALAREAARFMDQGQFEQAGKQLRTLLGNNPRDVSGLYVAAELARRTGKRGEAEQLFARCAQLSPDFDAARFRHANTLLEIGRPDAALQCAEELLGRAPTNPVFRGLKAMALELLDDYAAAETLWREVLKAGAPAEYWVRYAHVLRSLGRSNESVAASREAIARDPTLGRAWWSLAALTSFRFSETDIAEMKALAARPDMPAENRIPLLFALGKACGDQTDYEKSFSFYARGNALRRLSIRHDPNLLTSHVARCKEVFTEAFFRERAGSGCESRAPIFLVGMLRSGSTLVEQILASHSQVEGTRELFNLGAIARQLQNDAGSKYPQPLRGCDPTEFRALGDQYLESARPFRRLGRPFFVDKMGNNFVHLGLLHLMLPNAKIVDVRRHPMACGLSNFIQLYANGQDETYRLSDMGQHYRDYARLMAHFDRVLPGRVHRVLYEHLVADPETEIRRLLGYLELPFEESCLEFHRNARAVSTISSEQVRSPIYTGALEHWRHYEPWLAPLKAALGQLADAYPAVPALD